MSDEYYKKVFSKNLRRYMDIKGVSQIDMINDLNLNKSAVSSWVNGTRLPRMGKVEKLAHYFGIEKSDLIEEHSSAEVTSVRIPVTGMIHAGIPADAVEDIIDWEDITPDIARRGEIIALQVKGDCMEPKISDKDVVIVLQQSNCNSGDTVVAMVNSEEAMLRVLKKFEDGSINLVPTNPSYPVERFAPDEVQKLPVRIIGKVIELRAKF